MKKLWLAIIIFMSLFVLIGCFEDRIYLDFKVAEEIESLGPFEEVNVYYSGFRNEWDIKISASTLCGVVQLEVNNSSLRDGFNELKTKFECLKEKCK